MKSLGLIWRYLRHNLMSAMAYRGAFVLQVFGMLLNDLMLLVFWTLLFQRFPLLNGWDLTGVVTIYAVSASGFGLVVAVFGNLTRVAHVIASGDLDYYLALPANPLWHLLSSRTNLSGWGDLLFGVLLYVIVVPGGWQTLPLYVLLVILVALIFCAVGVLAGSLAFWLGQAQDLAAQWFNATLSFSLYPVDFFPGVVRVLLYTLLPAALVGSVPARALLQFRWQNLGLMVVFTLGAMALSHWVFFRGLRRYESGNMIVTRG